MIRVFSQYISPKSALLVAMESFLIILSLLFAVKIRFWNDTPEFEAYIDLPRFGWQAVLVVVIFQICFYFNDLYNGRAAQRRDEQALRLGQSLGAASLLLGLLYAFVPRMLVGRGVFFLNLATVTGLILLSRIALDRLWLATPTQNILVLGTDTLAVTLARELLRRKDLNINLVGFVQELSATRVGQAILNFPVLGSTAELDAIAERDHISKIIVALQDYRGILPSAALVRLRVQGVVVEDAHSVITALTGRVWLNTVRPSWFVFSDGFHRSAITILLKRSLDICCGVVGCLVSAPIMLAVAIAVRLDSTGPILYRQKRVGWKGKTFDVLKFRSMRVDAEAQAGAQWASVDDPRVTRIGKYLRKFRLDELPQFINVIRGDMSFVGPRPERPVFVDQLRKEIPYYDERHSVRPGLTGWAQVQYPYGASVEDAYRKLEYDLFYLKNMSVLFDFVIIFQTLRIVLCGKNGR